MLFLVDRARFFASHRLHLGRRALTEGYSVHLAAGDDAVVQSIAASGIGMHVIPIARGFAAPWRELRTLLAVDAVIRRVRPDLLHLVTIKAVLVGGILARRHRVGAVVYAISGLGYLFTSNTLSVRLVRQLILPIYRFALKHPRSAIIVQNRDDEAELLRLRIASFDRIVLIEGAGVDTEHFAAAPASMERTVLFIGRLLAHKGVRELVAAMRLVRREIPDARLILAGELDTANPSSVRPEELDGWILEGFVESPGHVDDIRDVMRRAAVVCLPSYREGLPKALLEAAACQRAIVATDVPGCRSAVVSGETGILVPARDPEALARALVALLVDPALCEAYGRAGRCYVAQRFSERAVQDATFRVYERLLSSVPGGAAALTNAPPN